MCFGVFIVLLRCRLLSSPLSLAAAGLHRQFWALDQLIGRADNLVGEGKNLKPLNDSIAE
jgi:hypothetical protein